MFVEQVDDGERGPGGHEGRALLPDVPALEDREDGVGPRGRSADAEFLELLHQARLGVAGGRRRAVALGCHRRHRDDRPDREHRQLCFALFGALALVGALDIDSAVPGEGDGGTGGGELAVGGCARSILGDCCTDTHRHRGADGIGHLRGKRALPDEAIQRQFLAIQLGGHLVGCAQRGGGPDALVGLLSVLHLVREVSDGLGDMRLAVDTLDLGAHCPECLLRQRHAVGTHIRDEATLVEALCKAHHLGSRQAQLSAALLLERRGHERRLRRRAVGLVLDTAYGEGGARQRAGECLGTRSVHHDGALLGRTGGVEVLAARDPGAVEGDEGGGERRAGGRQCCDVPVAGAHEGNALLLALHHEPDGGGLHPARRQTTVDLAPEHRRDLVAVQAVEDAAGLCGVHEAVVQTAGVGNGMVNGGLGDLVEHHALHGHLGLQVLEQVPRNGLPLAILVGGEIQLAGVLECRTQVLHDLATPLGQLVGGLEAVLDVHGHAATGKIGNVAHRGAHIELIAQEPGNGLRLGGRFDDNEWTGHGRVDRCTAGCLSRRVP